VVYWMTLSLKRKVFSAILPGKILVFRGPSSGATLYLSFDDGPDPDVTPKLLDLLTLHNVKATFFCIGTCLQEEPELARRIVSEGHLLANHSMSHPIFSQLNFLGKKQELLQGDALVALHTGAKNNLFRAPRGDWSIGLLGYMFLKGIVGAHWSYDSEDFQKEAAQKIIDRLVSIPPAAGEILLFHDDDVRCVDALSSLLPKWKEDGFDFDTMQRFSPKKN